MDPIRKKIRREAPGQLFGTVTHKMEPHDGVYNRWGGNGMFSCKMRIEFEPDPDVCEATSIAFVQTVSMLAGKKKVVPNPVEVRQVPTADFGAAVTAWNTQAAANKKSGQQALPVQRLAAQLPAPRAVPQPQRDPRMTDTASRARWAATLQRAAGNRASGALMASVQRCGGTVHDGCACADDAVQRQEKGRFTAAREEFVPRDEQR